MSKIFKSKHTDGEHWISISDMMSGLMMIFLFIAVSYMIKVVKEKEHIKEIAVTYNRLQTDLYGDLEKEFHKDLHKWNAVLDRQSLSVRFESPDVLFEQGDFVIKPLFCDILKDFFPRYISILTREKYRDDIDEIRIEGHTSSEWRFDVPPDVAYFRNMELSQNRTRSVLNNVLSLPDARVLNEKGWIKKYVTANGLSSSKLILVNGVEVPQASRRVEFRVRTNAEKRIVKIIANSQNETN
jgi:outer membrane protein OmpA-like peptidoglycan-associated protein